VVEEIRTDFLYILMFVLKILGNLHKHVIYVWDIGILPRLPLFPFPFSLWPHLDIWQVNNDTLAIGLRDAIDTSYLIASTWHGCSLDVVIFIVSIVLYNLKKPIYASSLLP